MEDQKSPYQWRKCPAGGGDALTFYQDGPEKFYFCLFQRQEGGWWIHNYAPFRTLAIPDIKKIILDRFPSAKFDNLRVMLSEADEILFALMDYDSIFDEVL
jgi:hypothetical protein